ncbi:MAG: HAMP domain-containing histidine kinase, partial [Bdellovibrionales bacterium]|nr:HAMP domain-containing histidine kinase [Bdellovibrionales bacterium]
MFKLSHCRKNQISKYLKYIVSIGFPASIIALWLLICQVVFFFIQSNQGVELTHAINALVRSDLVSSNFDYLARTIGDLERLGAIHCPLLEQIHPHYKAILDLRYRGGCTEHSALLSGEKFEIVSEATNGDQYRIKYSTHNQVSFAIGLWAMRLGGLLLLVTIYLVQGIRQAQLLNITNLRLENAQKISHLSAQIAHDIRSPLSALNIIIGSATNLPENQRTIIRSAVQRISDIANDLLLRGKTSVSSESPVLTKDLGQIFPSDHQALNMLAKDQNHSEAISILTVLQAVSNEKRIQYQNRDGIEIRDDFECAYGLFACISPSGLARVISNLVN